jgi:hypothetical protein
MVREELLDLEHRGWQALSASTGADFYGRIMTSDGVMVLAHGQVLDRQGVIESLGSAPPWRDYEISDERLVLAGDAQAILVYTGRARREDGDPAFAAVMSSVYTREAGGWRLALYQQTPVPAGA